MSQLGHEEVIRDTREEEVGDTYTYYVKVEEAHIGNE